MGHTDIKVSRGGETTQIRFVEPDPRGSGWVDTVINDGKPAIAMNASGRIVVAFESFLRDGSGDWIFAVAGVSGEVMEIRPDDPRALPLNTFTAGNQKAPAVAIDGAGNYVVTWQSEGQDGSQTGVYARRYTSSGTPLGDEFRVNDATANAQQAPAIAMLDDGDFIIVWESNHAGGFRIEGQRYNALGERQGDNFLVSSLDSPGHRSMPAIAMTRDGEFVVAWHDSTMLNGSNVRAQRFDALSHKLGEEIVVNTTTGGNVLWPSVVMDQGGNFTITWTYTGGGQFTSETASGSDGRWPEAATTSRVPSTIISRSSSRRARRGSGTPAGPVGTRLAVGVWNR
jgi:hypothetical protein